MKIVLSTTYPYNKNNIRGGVEAAMVGLVEELKNYPIELHIVTFTNEIKKNEIKKAGNITLHYLRSTQLPNFISTIFFEQYRLYKEIKKINPDLINSHMTGILSNKLLKSKYPSIITVHGIVNEESKHWQGFFGLFKKIIYNKIENNIFKKAKNIVVVSQYVKLQIENKCIGTINVIPNGVRKKFFKIKNKEVKNRLLTIGGIESRKGLYNLLKCIKIIKKNIPNITLYIVGKVRNKNYYNKLTQYIKENNLSKQVFFKHELDDNGLINQIRESSLFVFPSIEESFGIVLLEMMAARKAVVATRIGGIPFVVEENKTAYLTEYSDIEGLVNNIVKLLNNNKLRKQFGKRGERRAMKFLDKENAKKYYKLYKKILKEI